MSLRAQNTAFGFFYILSNIELYSFARVNRNARALSTNHVKYFFKVSLCNKLL